MSHTYFAKTYFLDIVSAWV